MKLISEESCKRTKTQESRGEADEVLSKRWNNSDETRNKRPVAAFSSMVVGKMAGEKNEVC